MVEFKRSIRCSNCGNETNIYMSSEMALNELLIHGRCNSCGNSLQLNFNIVERSPEKEKEAEEGQGIDIENALSPGRQEESNDLPSDAIRDLIGG